MTAGLAASALALGLAGCGGGGGGKGGAKGDGPSASPGKVDTAKADRTHIPDVRPGLQKKIPANTRQVVTVYGKGKNSAEATVRLYTRKAAGNAWRTQRSWSAHNGRKGWTPRHREGDKRSPEGVFSLSDAGGVLAAPGTKLPYSHSTAFTPPAYWPKKTRHDFDHVIAVDYNRAKGRSPLDPARPMGQSRGGNIWLHVDHGSGTSGCVTLRRSAIAYLLRTLDPHQHPRAVMGDRAALAR